MSLIRQLAGQTVIYGFGHILSRILYFIVLTTYLTNRLPDTAEFGVYAELYAYASILIVMISYRIDTAFFRFGSDKGNLEKSFSTAFIPLIFSTLFFVGLGILCSKAIASLIAHESNLHYIKWFAVIIGFDVLTLLPFAKLRLDNKAAQFVGFKLFNIILTILLVLFFLEFIPKYGQVFGDLIPVLSSEVDYVFLSNLIASAALFICVVIATKPKLQKPDFGLWKKMVLYSLPLVIVGIAGSFNQFFSAPLQKFLLGNSYEENLIQVGIYAAPQKIAALLALFTTAFNYAAEPFFFRNKDKKESPEMYGKICLIFTMVGGIGVLFLFFYIDFFKYLIGPSYREGIVIIPILLMAYLLLGIYYNISIWYKLSDKTSYGAVIACVGAVVTFSINFIYLPKIGYIASAWAALATYVTMNVLAYFLGQRHYKIKYPVAKILALIALLAISILLGMGIDTLDLAFGVRLFLKSCLILMFVTTSYLMERKTFKELFVLK